MIAMLAKRLYNHNNLVLHIVAMIQGNLVTHNFIEFKKSWWLRGGTDDGSSSSK